jgi:hypothetical protein
VIGQRPAGLGSDATTPPASRYFRRSGGIAPCRRLADQGEDFLAKTMREYKDNSRNGTAGNALGAALQDGH